MSVALAAGVMVGLTQSPAMAAPVAGRVEASPVLVPAQMQTVQYYRGGPYGYGYGRPYYRPYPRYYARRYYAPPPRPFYRHYGRPHFYGRPYY